MYRFYYWSFLLSFFGKLSLLLNSHKFGVVPFLSQFSENTLGSQFLRYDTCFFSLSSSLECKNLIISNNTSGFVFYPTGYATTSLAESLTTPFFGLPAVLGNNTNLAK